MNFTNLDYGLLFIFKVCAEVDSFSKASQILKVKQPAVSYSISKLEDLLNPQVVRTAEMMDMLCIVFVRGKRPEQEVIDLARSKGIVLLSTEKRLFVACGILYTNGLGG